MSRRPTVANMPFGRTTQGQLVSGMASPLTGPATAMTAERGLHRQAVDNRGLDGVVDGGEVRGLHDLRLARLGSGIHDHGEARIGAADVADQDRKFESVRVPARICHLCSRPASDGAQPFSLSFSKIRPVARFSAIGMS